MGNGEKLAAERLFFIDVLRSGQCQCEVPKKQGRALCYGCYVQLPRDMALALYRPIGEGFEEAYDEACRWLNE